ncbi:hypothetical protein BDV23DRAFT_25441 [Aspergillus alliaceus]|uniref:Uncharacterized protein n=1 Tax=Petromyces alliaceus TaxID=209559 RepID=A0A5N7BTD1_PETAA|nr:hypothetical protein BDV23DRAFT_25441 [Aspergillus alliaceus]
MALGAIFTPTFVIEISLGRIKTFGYVCAPGFNSAYEFHPLVKKGDGAITRIFHDGLDLPHKIITEIGVTCDFQSDAGAIG